MNRLILLLLTCVLGIVAARSLTENSTHTVSLVDLLPQDTLALIECHQLPQTWVHWRNGLLGSTVLRPEFTAFLSRHHLIESDTLPGLSLLSVMDGLSRRPGFGQLFDGHLMVALPPPPAGDNGGTASLLNRSLFLREINAATDVRHELTQVFGEVITSSSSAYQGQILHHLRFDQGLELTYLSHDNLLLWSFDAGIMQQSAQQLVQLLVPTHTRRHSSRALQRLRQMSGSDSTMFLYAQDQALRSFLPATAAFFDGQGWPIPKHLALFTNPVQKGERLVLAAFADEQRLRELRERYRLRPPVLKPALQRLSTSTGLVLWSNWLHLDRIWPMLQDQGPEDLSSLLRQALESLATRSGMTVDAFLTLFGAEAGLFLDYSHAPHQAPRSKAGITLEIVDRQRLESICKQLLNGLQTVEVVSGDLRIVTTILANGLLQPAYALFDQQLVLADGVELIERWYNQNRQMDSGESDEPLLDGRRCNFFLFLRTADMVEWLFPMATAIGKEYAARLGEDYRHWLLADPFFTAFLAKLRGIETSRLRGLIDTDTLLLELFWTLPPR